MLKTLRTTWILPAAVLVFAGCGGGGEMADGAATDVANPCVANPCASTEDDRDANPCAANPCDAEKGMNPCDANPCVANPCAST